MTVHKIALRELENAQNKLNETDISTITRGTDFWYTLSLKKKIRLIRVCEALYDKQLNPNVCPFDLVFDLDERIIMKKLCKNLYTGDIQVITSFITDLVEFSNK
jgi:hypothetical protein